MGWVWSAAPPLLSTYSPIHPFTHSPRAMYFVIAPDGSQYGPADLPTLTQWAHEGRVLASTTIRDARTGQTMVAAAIPNLFPGGPASPYSSPSPPQYAAYPRGVAGPYADPSSQSDLTAAWVLSVLS